MFFSLVSWSHWLPVCCLLLWLLSDAGYRDLLLRPRVDVLLCNAFSPTICPWGGLRLQYVTSDVATAKAVYFLWTCRSVMQLCLFMRPQRPGRKWSPGIFNTHTNYQVPIQSLGAGRNRHSWHIAATWHFSCSACKYPFANRSNMDSWQILTDSFDLKRVSEEWTVTLQEIQLQAKHGRRPQHRRLLRAIEVQHQL